MPYALVWVWIEDLGYSDRWMHNGRRTEHYVSSDVARFDMQIALHQFRFEKIVNQLHQTSRIASANKFDGLEPDSSLFLAANR